ncbi:dynein light chain binding protein [Aureococcus anophagefferens]|nr:dynein light chain binding protein [Aureococcus anophagefferens]
MGFAIPDAALNVTLQEDKYHSYRQNLQLKLRKYDALLAAEPVDASFFIEACDKALNEFAGAVSQIQKSSTMIDEIVAAIEGTVLAQAIDLRSDGRTGAPVLTDVTEFYEAMETKRAVKNIVESAKVFVRWKRGTCLECEPQVVHEDEEPFVFSFFQDVSSNQHIVALQRSLTANIQNLTMSSGKISNYLESWTIYDRKYKLWDAKARANLEKLHDNPPSFVFFDAKLSFYAALSEQAAMDVLTEKIEAYEKDMAIEPEDLEALKFVLNTITTITDESMDMELKYFDVERYRTLQRYDVAVAEEESSVAAGLAARWHALYCTAKTKDLRLAKVKEEFASVTLEDGVALLVDYKRTLAKCHAKKSELVNAENLFDLEITPYPVLATMSEELRRLSLIYKLYEARGRRLETLWSSGRPCPSRSGASSTSTLKGGVETAEKQMRKLPGDLKENSKFKAVETVIANFKESLPVIVNLKNEAMKDRHWNKLTEVTGVPIDNVKSITLAKIFAMELQNFGEAIDEIVLEAINELKIENEIRAIESTWASTNLDVRVYSKDGTQRGFILGGAEEIKLNLEDNMLNLQTMSGSRFVGAFAQKPNVIKACTSNNCFDVLTNLGERLDKCQKSLTDYLDTKRNAFSRFYFISDDELLSVLGSSDPTSIQVHMLKLFDNVKELIFARNAKSVTGMVASEKESFNLDPPSPIDGPVEVWMTKVEESMKESLHGITKAGIWWTWEVEDAFRLVGTGDKYALKNLEQKLTGQLNDLVAMVRTSLNKINRKKVNTLLIIDVHSRDIVDSFIRESILHAKEFAWESQLRFYWDRDIDDCVIKQCTGFFRYGYEYMGLNGRLVITPLTDRCYMTITQALTFKLGGSPAGPAGTGKTETVKDLAKSLALPCFVINCGEGLDYKAMGSIFSGLVQAGAWGCFDEFNRINIEVLSVVSAVSRALIYDKPSCDIGMGEIFVKRVAGFATCGFFITMNPGYAGRTELPDNLKALFRPVTMIVPDLQMICEIMLFSEGFEGAKVLARKMTVLYKLSKEQLSKQYHYDFGLRSLKSVLAQPLHELYGIMDPVTRDWTDGVLSRLFRELNEPLPKGKENEMRWIIYDGDVDAVWVENMNSVMDDNRLLTLPNGERIRLQPHCAMICETFDLQYASPATISRCGMVWVDPKNLGYRPFYERWVRKRCGNGRDIAPDKEEEAGHLEALFDQYVTKCIDYVQFGLVDGELGAKLRSVIPITSIDMIKQLTTALDAFLGPLYEHMPPETLPERDDIENVYAFCVNWSIGAALLGSSMELFNAFVKKIATCGLPDGLIADNVFDPESKRWEKWSARVAEYVEPSPFRFYEIIVPTTDSTKFSHLLQEMAPRKPILFVGASGTAKTTIINDYLGSLDDEVSARSRRLLEPPSSRDVQANIEANVDKRTGNFYGPPVGKKLTIFIDDMNMPKVDTYGTQQPITLLLTLISRGFIYDREKDLTQKILKDLCYIGAMGPPGGGRNKVDTRFVALFSVFNLPDPAQEVLAHIVKDVGAKFPEAMLKLFAFIVESLPPTPAKFHYIFNLRDLSRVTEGICLATPDTFDTSWSIVRLFRNEVQRIFCDRLVSEADLTLVEGKVSELIGEAFPECKDEALENPLVFGDYKHAVRRLTEEAEDPRLYCDMGSFEGTRKIFDAVMENYNMDNSPMTLVLFEQALEHLTRVHRIIRLPRGNALLIGVGGSGKQSLTRLAAYCAGYDIFNISLEGFLEFLNNMLTTGMVPALYEQDERDQLCNSMRKQVKELGIIDTPDNLWKYYVSKCQNNLHIVLAMSPSGDKLRLRCRSFPGLISNAVIDWFFPGPGALSKVANYFLAEVPLPAENREAIVQHLAAPRGAPRYYYVTPKNYLDYIQNYQSQLSLNEKKVDSSVKRLSGGLSKLVDAAKDVDRMSIELTDAKVIVDAKTTDVEALITQIQEKTKIANEQKAEATIKQEQASEQAVVIATEKQKADDALSEAIPALEQAESALANLHKEDIAEIKNFAKPPKLVQDVCLMVVCLRPTGEKLDETWADAKKMLSIPSSSTS